MRKRDEMKRSFVALMSLFWVLTACAEDELPDPAGACEGDCGDLFVACFQAGSVLPLDMEELTLGEGAADGFAGPQALAAFGEEHLLVVGALDGSFTVLHRETLERVSQIILKDSRMLDSLVVRGDRAYVIASGTNEVVAVDLRDPAKPKIEFSVSTGENTNPLGAAFDDDGVLWVSLWLTNQLLPIVDGVAGEPVDLPAAEGQPLPTGVAFAGGKVFVSLSNLDEEWAPAGNGRLVAVSPESRETELIDLGSGCVNPEYLATDGSRVYVPCGSFTGDVGAVAAYEVETGAVQVVATGGNLARLSLHPGKPGVVYAADSATTDLVLVDFNQEEGAQVQRHEVCAEADWEFVADVLAAP